MSETAIRVENLGKRYRIGATAGYKTLRESLVNAATAPFRRFHSATDKPSITNQKTHHIWAVRNVSFDIASGQAVGIIGANGSGKSTLLKILSRIIRPTEGRAEIHGRVASLLEVGTGFHPELTGRENINLNAAVLGMKSIEVKRKFDAIIDFAGDTVKNFIDTPVKRYSSGMYVRLAFGIAAHLDTDVLLVDEVLAVGDTEFQEKCIGKMGDVARSGRTVVFVSHSMNAVSRLCQRAILLEAGRVIMDDNIDDVIGRYLHVGHGQAGEVSWASPEVAPGNEQARLKAVRIVSEGSVNGEVDISKEFHIEVDYWNLKPDSHRYVGIQLFNSMGVCILISFNWPSASLIADPWYDLPYPNGLFRTSCTIPGNFLNEGLHSISVYINASLSENIITVTNTLSFTIVDTGAMRKEYTGKWMGTVRPRLGWQTTQLS